MGPIHAHRRRNELIWACPGPSSRQADDRQEKKQAGIAGNLHNQELVLSTKIENVKDQPVDSGRGRRT